MRILSLVIILSFLTTISYSQEVQLYGGLDGYKLGSVSTTYPTIIKGVNYEVAKAGIVIPALYSNTGIMINNDSCIDLEINYSMYFYNSKNGDDISKKVDGSLVINAKSSTLLKPSTTEIKNSQSFRIEYMSTKYGQIDFGYPLIIEDIEDINNIQVAYCLGFSSKEELKNQVQSYFNDLRQKNRTEEEQRIADRRSKNQDYFYNQEKKYRSELMATSINDIQKNLFEDYYNNGFYVNPPMTYISAIAKSSNKPLFIVPGYTNPRPFELNSEDIEILMNHFILVLGGKFGSEVFNWWDYKFYNNDDISFGYPGIFIVYPDGRVDGAILGYGEVAPRIKALIESLKANK